MMALEMDEKVEKLVLLLLGGLALKVLAALVLLSRESFLYRESFR